MVFVTLFLLKMFYVSHFLYVRHQTEVLLYRLVSCPGGAGAPIHWQCAASLHYRGFPHSLRDHQGAHRSQRQLPLYLSPSHPAPSPLAVLPSYLPLCAPSQPMIIVGHIPTYDTTRIGYICPIHTYLTPLLVHLFMETFGDLL